MIEHGDTDLVRDLWREIAELRKEIDHVKRAAATMAVTIAGPPQCDRDVEDMFRLAPGEGSFIVAAVRESRREANQ